jgi:hypothetical protein
MGKSFWLSITYSTLLMTSGSRIYRSPNPRTRVRIWGIWICDRKSKIFSHFLFCLTEFSKEAHLVVVENTIINATHLVIVENTIINSTHLVIVENTIINATHLVIVENTIINATHPARIWGLSPVAVHSITVCVLLILQVICFKIYCRLNDVFILINFDLKWI